MLQITNECKCDFADMMPKRVSFEARFTHQCETCDGGITAESSNAYNQYFGYSGYDEHADGWEMELEEAI